MTPEGVKPEVWWELVAANPWRLTPKQCLALHLVCQYGTMLAASQATGIPQRNIKSRISKVRERRKMPGNDVRIYVMWDRYFQANKLDYV